VTITNTTDFQIKLFLAWFDGEATAGFSVAARPRVSAITVPNLVDIIFERDDSLQLTNVVALMVVVLNKTQLSIENHPYYFNSFTTYFNHPTLPGTVRLSDMLPNFDIPSFYRNLQSGNFDGNCLIGISSVIIAGDDMAYHKRSYFFDAVMLPIGNI
jgi:hypothetical protein